MSTNRRQFLARSSALTGAAMAGAFGRFGIESASAQAADYKALVCLFQFGGADSNNMVVADTDYADQQFLAEAFGKLKKYFLVEVDVGARGLVMTLIQIVNVIISDVPPGSMMGPGAGGGFGGGM